VPAAPVHAADALRDDHFKPHFARLGEDERTLGGDPFAEQDGVGALDEALELGAAFLDRLLADILFVELEKIKGDIRGAVAPSFVRRPAKSVCPSGRNTTASPSSRVCSTDSLPTASAILGRWSVNSVP
jgi:hypothetical protein